MTSLWLEVVLGLQNRGTLLTGACDVSMLSREWNLERSGQLLWGEKRKSRWSGCRVSSQPSSKLWAGLLAFCQRRKVQVYHLEGQSQMMLRAHVSIWSKKREPSCNCGSQERPEIPSWTLGFGLASRWISRFVSAMISLESAMESSNRSVCFSVLFQNRNHSRGSHKTVALDKLSTTVSGIQSKLVDNQRKRKHR